MFGNNGIVFETTGSHSKQWVVSEMARWACVRNAGLTVEAMGCLGVPQRWRHRWPWFPSYKDFKHLKTMDMIAVSSQRGARIQWRGLSMDEVP